MGWIRMWFPSGKYFSPVSTLKNKKWKKYFWLHPSWLLKFCPPLICVIDSRVPFPSNHWSYLRQSCNPKKSLWWINLYLVMDIVYGNNQFSEWFTKSSSKCSYSLFTLKPLVFCLIILVLDSVTDCKHNCFSLIPKSNSSLWALYNTWNVGWYYSGKRYQTLLEPKKQLKNASFWYLLVLQVSSHEWLQR